MNVTSIHSRVAPAISLHATRAILPNLDGIRAMACILVVISHMPWPVKFETLGEVGVGVFFVLSGFLMSHLYASAQWDASSVCRYGIARFSRIAPVYWLVISVCVMISYIRPEDNFLLRIEGLNAIARHYLFAGNVLIFWSIPLEVQYYVFFLLVWWAIARDQKCVYALPLLALVCAVLLVTHTHWTGLMLPHKLHFFLAGTLAGVVPRRTWYVGLDTGVLSLLQLAALALLALPLWMYTSKPALYEASALGLSMALAVYLLSIPSPWTRAVFASSWVRKIGQASFSIYLMHVLVFHYGMQLLQLQHEVFDWRWLPLGVAGVALPMVISHNVELPMQRVTRKWLEARLGLSTFAGISHFRPGVRNDLL
jgi:peptidoglycan/LPS O-acetylase OafA/YrhL